MPDAAKITAVSTNARPLFSNFNAFFLPVAYYLLCYSKFYIVIVDYTTVSAQKHFMFRAAAAVACATRSLQTSIFSKLVACN